MHCCQPLRVGRIAHAGRYSDYASTMSWSDCRRRRTSALPFAACWRLAAEWLPPQRRGSPKFCAKPLKHLPWTPTPARRRRLANSRATLLASSEKRPWPSDANTHFVAEYLHLRCGRRFAIAPASHNSLPPYVWSPVPARWLTFSRVGLSN
jgi:hypothetical protein